MSTPPRWFTDTGPEHSQWYVERFRKMAADGVDLAGEARLLDAMVVPRSRILDAGCGPGRVGAALAARGHVVVGVDVDIELIAAARADHPGPTWLVADLAELDLPACGHPELFDAAILAGNVLAFVGPGTERAVLSHIGRHIRPDGVVVAGFGTDRGYPVADFDEDAAAAGLVLEHRFATWDLRPWSADASFAVSILRKPAVA
jgi:SAM-dependent methyltransferase